MLGYSPREYYQGFQETWPAVRRESYLYRADVLKPLSADERVWPSILTTERRAGAKGGDGYQTCWAALKGVQQAVGRAVLESPLPAWRTVAVTLVHDEYARDAGVPWDERVPPAEPAAVGADWEFLGYDVCDQYMTSALMNCGYPPGFAGLPRLRATWGPALNPFHLFDDPARAAAFRDYSNARLAGDHAPCFLFGLWIVK